MPAMVGHAVAVDNASPSVYGVLVLHTVYAMETQVRRVHLHLAEPQFERLKQRSERTGLPVAELIRRAVDRDLSQVDRQPSKPRTTKS